MAGQCEPVKTVVQWLGRRRKEKEESPGEQKKGQQQLFQGARHAGGMRLCPPPMFHEAGLPVPAPPAGDEMSTYIALLI